MLRDVVKTDIPVRNTALFGYFGSQINITDGRYLYMHSAENPQMLLYQYTLMPTHMRCMFGAEQLRQAELSGPLSFTKGMPVLKCPSRPVNGDSNRFGSMLFDMAEGDGRNILEERADIVGHMKRQIAGHMRVNGAPAEYFDRMGIEREDIG